MISIDRLNAQLEGRLHYHGKECKACGETLKYVNNYRCVFCTHDEVRKQQRKPRKRIIKRTQTYWFTTCKHCGKEFRTFPSKIARGWSKFCGRACFGAERTHAGKRNNQSVS